MPIYMPSFPAFRNSTFGLQTNTQRFESPFSRYVQRQLLAGSRWQASYTLPRMHRDSAAYWQAFFLSLEGGVNTFYAFDPDAISPRGVASGNPLVLGGSQTGSSLNTDGWTASTINILVPGDYMSINGELKMITQAASSDGSGNATLSFKPALRESPADNEPIILYRASCLMILDSDSQASWSADYNSVYDEMTFTAHEVFV
jgi:hypothetical protein